MFIFPYASADFWTLLLSKVVAVFMHGQQNAQAALAAFTEQGQQRTNAFSRLGLPHFSKTFNTHSQLDTVSEP